MLGSQDSSLRAALQANALQPQQPVVPASIPDQSPLRAQSTSETSVSNSERSSCYCTPFHGLWCAPAHGRLLSKLREQQWKDKPTPYLDTLLAAFPQQS